MDQNEGLGPDTQEGEVASSHEQRGNLERVPEYSPVPHGDGPGADPAVARAASAGYPAIEDPLPGIDQLVTVQTLEALVQRQWIGPMADPETLARYDQVVPGMGERLLKVYESQTVQVSDREDAIVKNRHEIDKNGQAWAGMLALVCVLAAIPMLALGNIAGGAIILGMPVVVLIGSFIPAKKKDE
ncbi:MAG: hypothetical protein IPJ61_13045 [Tessaracoccus sp.]|uniref:hypothetical protein n=1 Tax=Tessaracoccus sp. TaxID=1971211 RepID=UPI001ED2C186|nr:hypothetical protein [Tessaracoccus sp.]MBK7821964.1 hypothetical protein [Tessaracoccus sp.]